MTGCSDLPNLLGMESQIYTKAIPSDEATSEEKEKIELALSKIESIATELGYDKKFRKLPIIVQATSLSMGRNSGYCAWDQNGDGRYIALNRSIFASDPSANRFDFLFGVLLHEIGHCYFRRGHESRVFKKEGFRISVEVTDESGGTQISLDEIPVSIMYTKTSQESFLLIKVPLNFQKYFVSEVLGVARINSDSDLANIPGVHLIPK